MRDNLNIVLIIYTFLLIILYLKKTNYTVVFLATMVNKEARNMTGISKEDRTYFNLETHKLYFITTLRDVYEINLN